MKTTATGDDGAFSFDGLAPGRYTVEAGRPGFVKMAHGTRLFGRPGLPVVLAAGQKLSGVSVALPKGGVIAGTVRDSRGRPVRNASVTAAQPGVLGYESERTLVPVIASHVPGARPSAATDDDGQYRLFGLPPGVYAVRASAPPGSPLPHFFHPETLDADAATFLRLGAGEEHHGIDIVLRDVPLATLRGTVVGGPNGAAGTLVFLVPRGNRQPSFPLGASGEFSFADVWPGEYIVAARLIDTAARPPRAFWGQAQVNVYGQDVENVSIALRPGMSLRGRITVQGEGSAAPPAVWSGATVNLRWVSPWATSPPPASVASDGSFRIDAVAPGRYRLELSQAEKGGGSPGLTVQSVIIGGQEVVDLPFDLTPEHSVTEVLVTLTRLQQDLSGTLRDQAGTPRSDATLLVFPADRRYWFPLSRRVRLVRPATDGHFAVTDLPAGDYRLVAFGEAEPNDVYDPRVLAPLIDAGIPLTLQPGERKVQDIRIGPASY